MSSVAAEPWTDDIFSPGSLYGSDEPKRELTPYRVRIGEDIYDQSEFTGDTGHRYQLFSGGVGSGKTVGGLIRMAAHTNVWNPGELGAIITPTTYGIKNAILPKLERWGFFEAGWDYHGPQSEAPGLHAPNGTRVLLESANNQRKIQRLRGYDLAWFWLDEAAYIPEDAWRVLTSRLRIGNYPNGFATTTPKGFNWVHEKFVDEETRLPSTKAVLGVQSYANPHTPLEYRKDILGDFSGQHHAQEVLGEFVQFEGLVYPWFDDANIISLEEGESLVDRVGNIRQVFYGLDWGFYPHPAALIAFGRTSRDMIVAMGEHYETRNTVEDLVEVAQRMYDTHGRGPIYCDPSEPSNIETFQRNSLDARKADNSVEPGIQHVSSLAERFRVLDICQSLINEMNQYRYDEDGDAPIEKNDHACDASRYGTFTHSQEGDWNVGVAFG